MNDELPWELSPVMRLGAGVLVVVSAAALMAGCVLIFA